MHSQSSVVQVRIGTHTHRFGGLRYNINDPQRLLINNTQTLVTPSHTQNTNTPQSKTNTMCKFKQTHQETYTNILYRKQGNSHMIININNKTLALKMSIVKRLQNGPVDSQTK